MGAAGERVVGGEAGWGMLSDALVCNRPSRACISRLKMFAGGVLGLGPRGVGIRRYRQYGSKAKYPCMKPAHL